MEEQNRGRNIGFMILAIVVMVVLSFGFGGLGNIAFDGMMKSSDPVTATFGMYFGQTILSCVAIIVFCLIVKPFRDCLGLFRGNGAGKCIKWIIIGVICGAGALMVVAFVAMLTGSFSLTFLQFNFGSAILLFVGVLVQSASEELMCRMFLMTYILKAFPKVPAIAFVGNAVIFAALHLMNPGTSVVSIIALILVGILYSIMVYYSNSLWGAIIAHTTWNFTQSIVLGLPNSGTVVPYHIFGINGNVTSGIAYDTTFGLEASVMSMIVLVVCGVIIFLCCRKKKQVNA